MHSGPARTKGGFEPAMTGVSQGFSGVSRTEVGIVASRGPASNLRFVQAALSCPRRSDQA